MRSGDIHPLPGSHQQDSTKIRTPNEFKSNVKIAHLNVCSLKSREHFTLVEDTILQNGFQIFTISETWADLSVSDASLQIPGYQLFRQDCGIKKSGGGLCTYVINDVKATVLNDLSEASTDGFQQQWLKVQCRSYKSFLVCNVYRPPSIPTNCLESLAKNLVDSSLLNLDTILLGDLNCNLMGDSLEANSLKDFISSFNLSQMIGKPTRVTETTQSLIDVIMTSNESIVCLCDVLTCSISDHNLVYLVLALKIPRRKPYYVTIRSYKNYSGEEF